MPARATVRRAVVVALAAVLGVVSAAATATAEVDDQAERVAEETDDEQPAPGDGDDAPATTTSAGSLELTVTPVVGDGPDDGDLVAVDAPWEAALFFSPTAPVEQRAVYEFRVRNTGDLALRDVAVTDERMGTVLGAAAGTALGPGEEVVVGHAMTFTFDDAAGELGGLLSWETAATATDEADNEVTAASSNRLELVAVLASPSVELLLEVVPDVGDVTSDDPPTVRWTAGEAAADEVRVARYRATVTNTSSVDLIDLQVTVDLLADPLVDATEGVVLAPGEQLVRTFDRQVRSDETGDVVGRDVELPAIATLTAVEAFQGQEVAATDEAVLQAVVLPPEEADVLPAAGLDATTLVMLVPALLLAGAIMVGRARRAGPGRGR